MQLGGTMYIKWLCYGSGAAGELYAVHCTQLCCVIASVRGEGGGGIGIERQGGMLAELWSTITFTYLFT